MTTEWDLRKLRILRALDDCGTVTAAAARLPGLSGAGRAGGAAVASAVTREHCGSMLHKMRAEYGDEGPTGPVKTWHMVRDENDVAMCGRDLSADSATREQTEWGTTKETCCRACGVIYLQSVPFLADEHDRHDYIP